jgi:ABC-type transport system substrate-binding protein
VTRRLSLALLAAAVAVSGCGLVPGAHLAAAPKAVPAAHTGGVLRVAISRPGAVDPGNAAEPSSRLIASTMCDTLLTIDPKTNELRPGIVQSWLVTEQYNATDIVLKIRHGLKFSDGTTVDAKSIASSLSRIALEDYASPMSYRLSEVAGFNSAAGRNPKAGDWSRHHLGGVQITDPYGLEIYLSDTERDASFIRVLADPALAPISPRQVADYPRAEHHPVCSGPYKLASDWRATDNSIRLVRTPGYTGVSPGLSRYGAGYADEIDFQVYPTAKARLAAYERGEVDLTGLPLDLRAAAQRLGSDFVEGNDDYVQYIGASVRSDSPFASAATRTAISLALDRTALVRDVYSGGRLPATGLLPPALGKQFQRNACGAMSPVSPDVAAAHRLLDSAHVSLSGKRVNFYFPRGHGNDALAHAVAAQLAAAFALVVTPVPMSDTAFVQQGVSGTGFDGLYAEGWSSSQAVNYNSADAYLSSLTLPSGGGNFNGFVDPAWSRYYDEKARAVYASTSSTDDEAERRLAFQKAERIVCPLMAVIPIAFGRVHYLVRSAKLAAATGVVLDVRGTPLLRELFVR